MNPDLAVFESQRPLLIGLAYRMLGDIGRAEDMVQEAWLRWQARRVAVESPRAYLVTIVTRLCLNELESATARREESRGDRLPEPIDLTDVGIGRVDMLDRVSMAFLVVLQRLTPAERAVLLLRDVFDFDYAQIAKLIDKSEAACRKLLERAREHIAAEKRMYSTSPDTHERLLNAFMHAAATGNTQALVEMLAEDAVMITDGGMEGRRAGGIRNLPVPLQGAPGIASFVVATTRRGAVSLEAETHELNGQPAIVLYEKDVPFAAILLGVADDCIHRVFFHADARRLRYLGARRRTPDAS